MVMIIVKKKSFQCFNNSYIHKEKKGVNVHVVTVSSPDLAIDLLPSFHGVQFPQV